MPGKGDKARAELTAFIAEIDQTQRMSGFFGTTIVGIASAMRTFTEQVDEQFEAVDKRFEAVNRQFDQVDRQFEQVDRRFDRLDTQVGPIGDDVRKMSARMEELFGRIGHQEREGRPPAGQRKPQSTKTT